MLLQNPDWFLEDPFKKVPVPHPNRSDGARVYFDINFKQISARALKPSRGIWFTADILARGPLGFNASQSSEGLGFTALTRARGPRWGLTVVILFTPGVARRGLQFTAVTHAPGPSSATPG